MRPFDRGSRQMERVFTSGPLGPFRREIEASEVLFEQLIFMWCIENYVPLRQFNEGEILVTFYENLCSGPAKEIEKILSFIGGRFSSDVLEKSAKPSASSQEDSAIVSGTDLIDSWRKTINDEQIARAVEICSMFGLHSIYGESSLPLLSGEETLKILPP